MRVGVTGLYQAQQQWLTEITYRPGWSFELRETGYGPPLIFVLADVLDSNTGEPVKINHSFFMPEDYMPDREQFFALVMVCCLKVERHELHEWFKVDGRRVIDPHRDDNTRLYE